MRKAPLHHSFLGPITKARNQGDAGQSRPRQEAMTLSCGFTHASAIEDVQMVLRESLLLGTLKSKKLVAEAMVAKL